MKNTKILMGTNWGFYEKFLYLPRMNENENKGDSSHFAFIASKLVSIYNFHLW